MKKAFNPVLQNQIVGLHTLLDEDFAHSNSPIESINKIIQNNYLSKLCIENAAQLKNILAVIIEDYNTKRPHGSLKGATPDEVYASINPSFPTDEQIAIQKVRRRGINKGTCCALRENTDNNMFFTS